MENKELGLCPHCDVLLVEGDIEYRWFHIKIEGHYQHGGVAAYICGKCGKVLSIG